MSEPLIDATEVSKTTGVARTTVYKWAELGLLPCVRFGAALRFKPADVRAFIERHTHRASLAGPAEHVAP